MKPKVIVFGAGDSGQVYIKKQEDYHIIALTDNNKSKHGTEIDGIKVIAPENIVEYPYDYIVIASGHVKPIKKQLQTTLNIGLEKIVVPPKNQMKIIAHPFEDELTYDFATKVFKEIVSLFNKHNCQYYAEYGTLLGLVREQSLIRWDDDIDFAVLRENYQEIKSVIEGHLNELNRKFECEWQCIETFDMNKNTAALILKFTNLKERILPFHVSVMIIDIVNNTAYQLISSVPKEYFETFEEIRIGNLDVRVPNMYKDYLTLHYGDWKTPIRSTSFDIYHHEE